MWIWRFWLFLCGYVEFRAEGGLCERFLSMLSEGPDPVRLWNVRREEGAVLAFCCVSDYRRLRSPARRTGTRVRHVRQRGMYRCWRPLYRRFGLVVGCALAMAVYMLLASGVWVIDIQTADPVLRRRIEAQLAASGLTLGTPLKEVDVATVRMEAVANIEELHQLTLYFDGCIARVEVRLQEELLTTPDPAPANVVAAADGLILATRVTAGQSMVQVGEAVVEGELLVCGAVETDKGLLLRHATAEITAQTTRAMEVCVAKEEMQSATGRVWEQPTLCVFGWRLPLYSHAPLTEEWTVSTEERFITLFGTRLPVGITWDVLTEHVERPVSHTAQEVETLAVSRLEAAMAEAYPDARITGTEYSGVWEGDVYRLKGTFTCEENIAKTVPLLTDLT